MIFSAFYPFCDICGVTLYCGDCLEVLEGLEGTVFNACITDPPFGTTQCSWDSVIDFDKMWNALSHCVKEDGAVVLFGTEPFSSHLRLSARHGFHFKYDWVWHKSKSGSAFSAKYRPVCKHEMISVFGRGRTVYNPQTTPGTPYSRNHKKSSDDKNNHKIGLSAGGRSVNDGFRHPTTVQFFQQKWRRQDQLHPTQKPVELMEYLIRTYTNEGDIVLDFAAGSGTTGVAAMNCGRKCVLIEKEPKYCEIARKRLIDNAGIFGLAEQNQGDAESAS